MGSDQLPMTADQRLEQLLTEYRDRTPRGGDQIIGGNLLGSPMESPISPSQAMQMRSPPSELTRPLPAHPENIPITDFTSDEAGRRVTGVGGGPAMDVSLNQEVVMLTQRQLTSDFEIAEVNSLRAEAETRRQNAELELSQEVHMFNQARALIEEMRANFSIEDQGCIRRIEMLEDQRNEHATGLISQSNQAEATIHYQHVEHSEEVQ